MLDYNETDIRPRDYKLFSQNLEMICSCSARTAPYHADRYAYFLDVSEWVTVETFKIDSFANWRCVPSNSSIFFSLKTRCKPLSHTCILLILQVCFLALCVRECYMLKGILCVYYHSNELCLKSEREHTHKIASPTNPIQSNSDTAKIQPSISSGNEYRMNLFYSVVLWFRYRISKLTSLPHTRTNWNKLIARVNFGPNSLLYLLHWNSRPMIE